MKRAWLLLLGLIVFWACDAFEELPVGQEKTVWETLQEREDARLFVSVLERLEIVDTLQIVSPITVFVPDPQALQLWANGALPADADSEQLALARNRMLYHIVFNRRILGDIQEETLPTLFEPNVITVTLQSGRRVLNEQAAVIEGNVDARNGIIHFIDGFLNPL
ncbi:MAG: fasciclin domain-containing protein [Nitritalea sp.]